MIYRNNKEREEEEEKDRKRRNSFKHISRLRYKPEKEKQSIINNKAFQEYQKKTLK